MIESPVGTMTGYHLAKSQNPVWLETEAHRIRGVEDPLNTGGGVVSADESSGLGVEPEDLGEYYPFTR